MGIPISVATADRAEARKEALLIPIDCVKYRGTGWVFGGPRTAEQDPSITSVEVREYALHAKI